MYSDKKRGTAWLFPVILLFAVLAACGDTGAGQEEWLHGTWELTFNPENDDEDVLTFNQDGTVAIDTVDGRTIPGKYAVFDDELALTLVTNEKIIDVKFDISPDHSKLVYESGAYYTKRD